jgi:hypothetical protein
MAAIIPKRGAFLILNCHRRRAALSPAGRAPAWTWLPLPTTRRRNGPGGPRPASGPSAAAVPALDHYIRRGSSVRVSAVQFRPPAPPQVAHFPCLSLGHAHLVFAVVLPAGGKLVAIRPTFRPVRFLPTRQPVIFPTSRLPPSCGSARGGCTVVSSSSVAWRMISFTVTMSTPAMTM